MSSGVVQTLTKGSAVQSPPPSCGTGASTGAWVPKGQVHSHNGCFLSASLTLACCGDATEERDDRQALVTVEMTSEDT